MSSKLAIDGGTPVRTKPFSAWPVFDETDEQQLLTVLRSGKWGKLDGGQVARFERDFAAMHGAAHGIAVLNGTFSLQIALLALDIQAGDEVIVPPYTFIATATAVMLCNATPVFADLDLKTFNLSPAAVEAAITPRTRAIMPVHFAGLPADMDGLMAIAARHKLAVIEDAAHAHGAEYRGRRCGSIAPMGSFSFQSSKNLTAGEGGIIITSDAKLAAACRSIHNCGRIAGGPWYEHHLIGANYRLSDIQGALLNSQLARLEAQTAIRDANGRYLAAKLAELPGVMPQRTGPECTRHAFHLFCLRVDEQVIGMPRERFLQAVCAEGVPVSAGYPMGLYSQPCFVNKAFGPFSGCRFDAGTAERCPNTETICKKQGVWLEQRLFLGTRQDMDDIVEAFAKVVGSKQ